MASPSVLVSTSISLLISSTTSFSTIYQTSRPVFVTTFTSAATHLTTLTQPEVVMTSTLAFPTTITETIWNIFTSYAATPAPRSTEIVTSTVTATSTLIQPGETITYYPPTATFVLTPPTTYTISQPTSTITLTELIFFLENAVSQVYSTITTTVPAHVTPTAPVIFVLGSNHDRGWDSWGDAQKGGLIAGVVILFLIIVGIAAFLLLRRRNIWLASDWASQPAPAVVQQPMGGAVTPYQVQHGYWGYGPAGWGIRN